VDASTRLPRAAPARVLACGAFLKNAACLVDGDRVAWSPQHGDLGEVAACEALGRSVEALLAHAGGRIDAVAHDLHPDFRSTRVALALAGRLGVPAVAVQHHHAHVAAVQAELGIAAPVAGIALDGVGLGDDGLAWGGELLHVDGGTAAHRWRRLDHLRPIRLPGGDRAAIEPWRLAAAVLHSVGRGPEISTRFAPAVGAEAARTVAALLEHDLRCPPTTAAGRWFDAAAGALGLCMRQHAEAQAAIALEARARAALLAEPDLEAPACGLDLTATVAALLDVDRTDTDAVARGAARFHLALADGLADAAIRAACAHGLGDVVLGGGCFANRVLLERLSGTLRGAGLRVHAVPAPRCGDAGIALGQAWVAACAVASGIARAAEAA
jgi:hydrogenase maturation protein HypF